MDPKDALHVSSKVYEDDVEVDEIDFESMSSRDLHVVGKFAEDMGNLGFQATELGRAIKITKEMMSLKEAPPVPLPTGGFYHHENSDKKEPCFVWLSFTSNMISSGLRGILVHLAKNRLINCISTSAGGIEEDLMKCLGPTSLGEFLMPPSEMRSKGWNRIGNLVVPNDNYVRFEKWLQPRLDEMVKRQKEEGERWTPSKMIKMLGEEIADSNSLLYWCAVNDIPVFCPAITDGAIGDNIFLHGANREAEDRLVLDIVEDISAINNLAFGLRRSGAILLGGGVAKHHVMNANLMRNGLDYAIYITTAHEYDGCDSGGSPDEAVTWGKIRTNAKKVKVVAEATTVFPLLMAAVLAGRSSLSERAVK